MPETLDYIIDNIGGVEHAEFKFKPGVNVLAGPNGAGKTSSINGIRRAHGDDVEVERRDGSEKGTVEGPGVMLKVTQVARKTGSAEVTICDTAPVSMLIDPGLKDPDARARSRIRALVELLDLGIDDKFINIITGGDEALLEFARYIANEDQIDEILTLAGKVKKHAEGLARSQEGKAEQATGAQESARARRLLLCEELGVKPGKPLADGTAEKAQVALVEASRELEKFSASCAARIALEARQDRVRTALGDQADPAARKKEAKAAEAARVAAVAAEGKARLSLMRAEGEVDASDKRLEATLRAVAQAEKGVAILGEKAEGASEGEVASAEERVFDAKGLLARAVQADQVRALDVELADADGASASFLKEAERFRTMALSIPDRLGDVLKEAGAKGLTVREGRIVAVGPKGGGGRDFEKRLSDGQRISIVLDIAAERYKGLVPLDDAFWAKLDPDGKAEFAKACAERGLFAITEQPASGDLRVEHTDGEQG